MKKAITIVLFIIYSVLLIYLVNYYTLQCLKIDIVNEKENVIQVQSFGSTWIYEY